ncbi:dehydroascorbate reductase 2 [Artemisia annua]|uniref:Dehydroascorbate reductase 2 n=1 Tax=Artemisia annua TaxID=35608 RepID=A0A2U1QCT5_ARTAN|nr:dehydroascorbate reductase 2 [Artemisia annua]
MIGGHLRLVDAAANAYTVWMDGLRPTRIVFFAGGRLYLPLHRGRILATQLKDLNVACDVISFGDPYLDKKEFFDTFADHHGNCNVCYVPPESSVCEALSRSQIIIPRVGGGSSLPPSPSLSVQHDKTKKIDIYVKAPADSADDKTDCIFCQRVLLTLQEKDVPYKTTFIDLDSKTGWFDETRTLPLISFDNVTWFSNSNVIVDLIEKKYPEPRLVTPPHLAYLGLKILPKLAEFLKSKNETDENDASKQALLDELKELEVHLSENGPYVSGEKITAVDLSLATKLYHLEHACWRYKKWAVPDDLTAVQQYKKLLFDRDSFENTKPRPQNVNEGWRQRLSLK